MAKDKLEIKLDKTTFEAGEEVAGKVVANQDVEARSIAVSVAYYDQSDDYLECSTIAGEPIGHAGGLAKGEEIPFSFKLPEGALPDQKSSNGRLYWAAGVKADVEMGSDVTDSVELDVDPARAKKAKGSAAAAAGQPASLTTTGGSAFMGVAVIGVGAFIALLGLFQGQSILYLVAAGFAVVGLVMAIRGRLRARAGAAWDVSASASPTMVARGDKVEADVKIGSPAQGRQLEAGLVCTETYDHRTSSQNSGTSRKSKDVTRHEDWVKLDGSSPQQSVELAVPKDVPFSYPGTAFAFNWKLVIRDRSGVNKSAETALQVLP